MKLLITSDHEMQDLGQILGTHAVAGNILLLTGDLGAGKTTLTKGIAKALGIKRPVKSPTYTIVREYKEGKLPLFHMDMLYNNLFELCSSLQSTYSHLPSQFKLFDVPLCKV